MHNEKEIKIGYYTTSSYGKFAKKIPNLAKDEEFLHLINKLLHEDSNEYLDQKLTADKQDQLVFLSYMEQVFQRLVTSGGRFELFSDFPDHYGRKMGRFILKDPSKDYDYIIDLFARLDVKRVLSRTKRFMLLHMPRKLVSIDNSSIVPAIIYSIRIWNTSTSYYLIEYKECQMKDVPYTYDVERARRGVGIPQVYNPEDKNYERIDFDIRRAIFNEISSPIKGGDGRKGILTTRGNDS